MAVSAVDVVKDLDADTVDGLQGYSARTSPGCTATSTQRRRVPGPAAIRRRRRATGVDLLMARVDMPGRCLADRRLLASSAHGCVSALADSRPANSLALSTSGRLRQHCHAGASAAAVVTPSTGAARCC